MRGKKQTRGVGFGLELLQPPRGMGASASADVGASACATSCKAFALRELRLSARELKNFVFRELTTRDFPRRRIAIVMGQGALPLADCKGRAFTTLCQEPPLGGRRASAGTTTTTLVFLTGGRLCGYSLLHGSRDTVPCGV